MYFEFEVANSNDVAPQFDNSKPAAPSEDDKMQMQMSLDHRSSSSPTSPLAQRKSLFDHSTQDASTPVANNRSPFISPLLMPAASPISSLQRHRRYSIHSSPGPLTLDTLHDNSNVTFCDLALITKKKLLQLNCSYAKALDEESEPDVKLNAAFCKHSNKDLRREVLLASMQRSLSVSSDDLSLSPGSSSKMSDFSDGGGGGDPFKLLNERGLDITDDDLPMEIVTNSAAKTMLSECFATSKSPISRIRARRSLVSYTPDQNNYMSSQTTFTSTTSMAGGGKNGGINHRGGSYIKKLNMNALNLIGNGLGHNGTTGNYYYSNSASPKLTLTMSSLSNTPLKKRLHSSSPSKYPSPYHTISNSICKDFNVIFANANSGPLSPEWDVTFKRLKVMHCSGDPNGEAGREDEEAASADHMDPAKHNQLLALQPFAPNNNGQPEHELNELTQDFHRLKTPFT